MNLSGTTIAEATPTDMVQQALKTSAGRLNFQTLYGRRSLILGDLDSTGTRRWAQWEGEQSAFFIPEAALNVLKPESFLETRPVALNPADITALDWADGPATLSLRKLESGQWVIASQDNAAADPDAVKTLLEKLCAIEAGPTLKPATTSVATSEILRLQTVSQKLELSLIRSDGKTLAIGQGDRIVYVLAGWPQRPTARELLDRNLFAAPIEELQGVTFRTLQGSIHESALALSAPQSQALLAILKGQPKAKEWLDETVAAQSILKDSPAYQLVITLRDRAVTLDLWQAGDRWIGRLSGRYFTPEADLGGLFESLKTL